jgi:PAS domain S-box-containing protein
MSPGDLPTLTVVRGWGAGTRFPIAGPGTLGRDASCSVVLGSMAVSRKHARLVADGDAYLVEDLGSTQGTLLNGEALGEPTRLKPGDLIQVGDCVLAYSGPRQRRGGSEEGDTRIIQARESSRTGEWALSGVRAEDKLRAILDISRDLAGPLDFDEVLSRILEGVFRLFPQAERGFVILREGVDVVPRASRFRDPASTQRSPSRTVLDHAIGAGKAILCEDLQGDPTFGGSTSVDDARLRTLMCVPLRDHARNPVGAIQVDTSDPTARFTPDDLDLLAAVAAQVGMVVDNARLHDAARESLRRQAETQAFVDSLLAAAPLAMAFLDPELRFVRVSRAMAALNGLPPEDHLGRGIDMLGGGLAPGVEAIARDVALSGKAASEVEVVATPRPGTSPGRHWLCHCYPANDPGGRLVGLGIILEDVTEARRAEQELRSSEQRYRLLFEANPHPMWVYDLETLRFLAVNEAAIRRYGYTTEEFMALTIAQIRPKEDIPALLDRVAGIGGATYLNAGGWRHVTKAGELIDVEISSHTLTFEGRPARLVLASDVTLRVRAEASLLAAKEAAEAANRAKDRFLAVLSHELRTPLTPALLAASSLLGEAGTHPAQRAALEVIRRNIELESKLVDDLLDVARIGRGQLDLDLEAVDVHRSLREAMDICEPEVRAADLDVEWALDATHHHAMADPTRLRQVFWNLIRNAARYTPGGGRLRIGSRNEASGEPGDDDGGMIVEFIDTGMGIDPESLARIFEPFERGEAKGHVRVGGLGLGLAIGRSIVEAHGGRLTAESAGRGCGATFRLELSTVRPPAPVVSAPAPSVAASTGGARLLVVEDNADTRRYLELALRLRGFEVVAARDLEAARAAASTGAFDLLLSDIELPDGTGLELMAELSAHRPMRGIAMSGFGSEEDVRESLKAGFSDHLTKPLNIERLAAAIDHALGG